ncbi:SMI1/KNR4 family protein [Zhouia sp. PK063]|uniref:SMI1/KNR4 family protein n=1 Tax=Zhouia sp. PK063 TaxID=3373602 RepID=UPI0037AD85EE
MEITKIIETWRNSKIKLNEGAELTEIIQLEEQLEYKFPETFKQFYTRINGFKDSDWNEHMFSIFPLDRIKNEYETSENKDFIPFCDYLINSHQIGFSKKNDGIYINYENILGDFNDKVADSFELSLIEILNNSDKIY